MKKYSEIIHKDYQLGNFELTGDLNDDTRVTIDIYGK